jgi:predicted Ser/Thr protein kinase
VIVITKYYDLDIKKLELLGSGTQGKVYKIDDERCIKVFKSKKQCREELTTLVMAHGDGHFPELYHYGENYIVREYINGTELDNYLLSNKLTQELIAKLIELYEAMVNVGYRRLDAAIFHIFITEAGQLKLIDTAKAMKKKTQIPHLLISGIERLGYREELFNFLRINRPELYTLWIRYSKINYKKMS